MYIGATENTFPADGSRGLSPKMGICFCWSRKVFTGAKRILSDFTFPGNFYFLLDPNYSMVNKYGLRWDAPKETAYPSTFVMDKKGKIVYSKVSSTHGGRADVSEVLGVLKNL